MTRAPSAQPLPSAAGVAVRDIKGADELRACQQLQRLAWGISEDGYLLPVATMAAAQKVGGLVLGAFDATGDLVGFSFAFRGVWRGQSILYSQLTGVHPDRQARGIGRALKTAQWHRARADGLDAIVWAFDPLQAANARFNLVTLGAIACTYEVDLYGSRSDALNSGLQTDRLIAEWATHDDDVHDPPTTVWPAAFHPIVTAPDADGGSGLRTVDAVRAIPADARHVAIEIPARLAAVKQVPGPAAARAWQMAVRSAFENAFDQGFRAVGFSRENPAQPRYLLERPH